MREISMRLVICSRRGDWDILAEIGRQATAMQNPQVLAFDTQDMANSNLVNSVKGSCARILEDLDFTECMLPINEYGELASDDSHILEKNIVGADGKMDRKEDNVSASKSGATTIEVNNSACLPTTNVTEKEVLPDLELLKGKANKQVEPSRYSKLKALPQKLQDRVPESRMMASQC